MLDITVIILTKDEQRHIRRCLERLKPLEPRRVIVVDSHSSDGTQDIARELGAEVIEHDWPGNQAAQFNWALDNAAIQTEWVLRLDADEYLTPDLISELKNLLPSLNPTTTALVFPLGRAFLGKRLKHGIVNGVSMIRMFRNGKARYENRIMDEHLKISDGNCHTCKNHFIDDNRMPLSFFITKHNSYAEKEALLLLEQEIAEENNAANSLNESSNFAAEVQKKRQQKNKYGKLPLFWRAFGYFTYRYILKLGFLDGKEGFLWDFLQGFWYRTLVDAKIFEIKKYCTDSNTTVSAYLQDIRDNRTHI